MLSGLYRGSGLVIMSVSYAMLALFQRTFNFTSRVTRFFSQAAYAVYLVHPLVVPVTFSILEACKGVALVIGAGQVVVHAYGTDFGGDGRVWLGWGYTAVLSQLITWPLANKVRRPQSHHVPAACQPLSCRNTGIQGTASSRDILRLVLYTLKTLGPKEHPRRRGLREHATVVTRKYYCCRLLQTGPQVNPESNIEEPIC